MQEAEVGGFEASLDKGSKRPHLKNKLKETTGLELWLKLVEHLPHKCKALSSIP
jgi:hypothetical protein